MTEENGNLMKKLEFEHAWQYFELHANQRISLFRYYIIFFSLYVAGIGFLLAKKCELPHIVENQFIFFVSLGFILITIIFDLLDFRNETLIHLGEDSLRKFEKEQKFKEDYQIFTKEKKTSDSLIRHTYLFRAIFLIGILSSIIIIYYSCNRTNPCNGTNGCRVSTSPQTMNDNPYNNISIRAHQQ